MSECNPVRRSAPLLDGAVPELTGHRAPQAAGEAVGTRAEAESGRGGGRQEACPGGQAVPPRIRRGRQAFAWGRVAASAVRLILASVSFVELKPPAGMVLARCYGATEPTTGGLAPSRIVPGAGSEVFFGSKPYSSAQNSLQ
jgi:hypothetical protein